MAYETRLPSFSKASAGGISAQSGPALFPFRPGRFSFFDKIAAWPVTLCVGTLAGEQSFCQPLLADK